MNRTSATGTAVIAATEPRNRQERRHGVPPVVVAVHAPYVSKRGLMHDMYFARCHACGFYRRYQSTGFRICPCGARYQLIAGAVIA